MIYQNITKQKIKTFFIVFGFIIFWSIFLYIFGMVLTENSTESTIVISFAIIVSLISGLTMYFNSDKMVLKLNCARPATSEEHRQLQLLLEGLTIAANIKMPKLYVINDNSMNAFATGRNPEHAVICVTKGLLEKMDKYELEAVLAHELSHIKNYDILLSTTIAIMAGSIVLLSDLFKRFLFYGGGRRRKKRNDENNGAGILMLIGIVFIILAPIFTKLMQLSISRKREYLADATAVSLTRNKDGMINALTKLSGDSVIEIHNDATAHLFIASPVKQKKKKENIFSTHPSIENRIQAIRDLI